MLALRTVRVFMNVIPFHLKVCHLRLVSLGFLPSFRFLNLLLRAHKAVDRAFLNSQSLENVDVRVALQGLLVHHLLSLSLFKSEVTQAYGK